MWMWRRMEHIKWTDKIKNAVVLERVGEGRIMLELIRDKRNWLGHWLRRNSKQEESLRQKKMSDNILHYDKWTV